jgi:hypothetical protein
LKGYSRVSRCAILLIYIREQKDREKGTVHLETTAKRGKAPAKET